MILCFRINFVDEAIGSNWQGVTKQQSRVPESPSLQKKEKLRRIFRSTKSSSISLNETQMPRCPLVPKITLDDDGSITGANIDDVERGSLNISLSSLMNFQAQSAPPSSKNTPRPSFYGKPGDQ